MAFSSASSNQGGKRPAAVLDDGGGRLHWGPQPGSYSQRGPGKPATGFPVQQGNNVSAMLNEAVDTVVNSFAKHTQGYGRGRLNSFFLNRSV